MPEANDTQEAPEAVEAEESTDVEESLEDDETSFEDASESEEKETEDDSESVEELEDEAGFEEKEEKPEIEEATETEVPAEDRQKAFNKEMAQRRIQEKQYKEQSLKADQQEYVAGAEDEKDLAVRQLQVDAYNNRIESNSNKLTNGFERALQDFEILRDPSPEVQAEINAAIDAFQAMYVSVDRMGNPIETRGDLYTYLQSKADSIQRLTQIGARKENGAKARTKANTLTVPSASQKEAKKDPLLEGFDEEANRW